MLARRLWQNTDGAALVEYAIVLPLFLLVTLGLIDFSYMFVEWSQANKAAYIGARTAITSDPIASNITDPSFLFTSDQLANDLGEACLDPTTGAAPTGGAVCPPTTFSVTCTSTQCGICASCSLPTSTAVTFSSTAFTNADGTGVYDQMKAVFPSLQSQNVSVTYQINGAGFVGMPGGLPLDVTVSIIGQTHPFFFTPGLLSFFGAAVPNAWSFPTISSSLTSECMDTDPSDPPTC